MNIKSEWLDQFEDKLWAYHTCDWDVGNNKPDYPYQLATAYFDWGDGGQPERTVEEAFIDYLESLDE